MGLYLVTKKGFDGRQIRNPGEVINFDGPRGSWLVPCDEHGKPLAGEKDIVDQRPVKGGKPAGGGFTRDQLREQCRSLGISFPATAGAAALATLIAEHQNGGGSRPPADPSTDDSDKKPPASEGGQGGTGNQEVL